ncbi:MAG: hypothetical protein ACRELE_03560 [Gemmatimonadales bacterium]
MSGSGSRFWGVVLTLGLTSGALVFLFAMMEESRFITNRNPMPIFGALVAGAIFFALLRGPVGKAIARMLEGQSGRDEQLTPRVEQLEDRLADLGYDQQRIGELEDRLDFAERLLAQRGDSSLLRAPEHE